MVEFRLYYDDLGKVVGYSCCDMPGVKYIVIDAETYAESNPYVKVVDGKIHRQSDFFVVSSMNINDSGIACEPDDICVLTNSENNIKWKVEINEHRRC